MEIVFIYFDELEFDNRNRFVLNFSGGEDEVKVIFL